MNRGWVPTAWKEEAEARAAARLRQATSEAKEETSAVLAPSHSAATHSALTTSAARSWWSWLSGGTAGGDKAHSSQQPQSQSTQLATELPQPAVVVGVVQYDEHPSNFMPDNQPETEEFHFVQREAMVGPGLWIRPVGGVTACMETALKEWVGVVVSAVLQSVLWWRAKWGAP